MIVNEFFTRNWKQKFFWEHGAHTTPVNTYISLLSAVFVNRIHVCLSNRLSCDLRCDVHPVSHLFNRRFSRSRHVNTQRKNSLQLIQFVLVQEICALTVTAKIQHHFSEGETFKTKDPLYILEVVTARASDGKWECKGVGRWHGLISDQLSQTQNMRIFFLPFHFLFLPEFFFWTFQDADHAHVMRYLSKHRMV